MDSLYIFFIFIAGSILIILFLFRSKWIIKVNYQFPEMDDMEISVFFYKWCVLKKKKLRIPDQKEMEKGYVHFYKHLSRKQLHLLKQLQLRSLLKEIKVLEFKWQTKGGTGNAFTTSIASGAIWAIKGWLIGYLTQYLQLFENPQIRVQPDFKSCSLETSFSCMISFRLGKTILGILHVLKIKEVK